MDKEQIEQIITKELEKNGSWYNGSGCMIRAIERRSFKKVARNVTEKILNCI